MREIIHSRKKPEDGYTPVVITNLIRLWDLYGEELQRINLTLDECCLIAQTVKHFDGDPKLFWLTVEKRGQSNKWTGTVNVTDLAEYLKKLTPLQILAIVDCGERAGIMTGDFKTRVKLAFRLAIKES
jgi:hypothetical protein